MSVFSLAFLASTTQPDPFVSMDTKSLIVLCCGSRASQKLYSDDAVFDRATLRCDGRRPNQFRFSHKELSRFRFSSSASFGQKIF